MLVLVLADAAAALPAVGDPVIDALLRGGPMGLMLAAGIVLMRQWREWRREERAADVARDAAAAQRDAAREAAAAQRETERHAALDRILDRADQQRDRQHDRVIATVTDSARETQTQVPREVQAHVSREVQALRGDVQALRGDVQAALRTTQDRMLPVSVSVASGERRG